MDKKDRKSYLSKRQMNIVENLSKMCTILFDRTPSYHQSGNGQISALIYAEGYDHF